MATTNEKLAKRLEKIAKGLEKTGELDEDAFQEVDCGAEGNKVLSDAYDAWYDCDEEDVDNNSVLIDALRKVAEMLRKA